MPRPIWSGVISFGMVSIPVKLYAATESKDVSFHQLHKTDNTRIKQLRWCPIDERALAMDEIVRGYEYARDQYAILTDEDFDKLPLPSKRSIQLSAFVPRRKIDPIYYDRSYYLEPDALGLKPFHLLLQALTRKRLVAIAKIAIRSKEQLSCLRPYGGKILLETMFYPDEIRLTKGQDRRPVQIDERELEMAFTLIDLLSQPFNPASYRDGYREALMELIEAKLRGQEVVQAPPQPLHHPDLMAALKASIEEARRRRETVMGGKAQSDGHRTAAV